MNGNGFQLLEYVTTIGVLVPLGFHALATVSFGNWLDHQWQSAENYISGGLAELRLIKWYGRAN